MNDKAEPETPTPITGKCPASLTGLHVPDRKLSHWCRACDKGRLLPQGTQQRRPTSVQLADPEPEPELPGCEADPRGFGLHWRHLSDQKDWCRACGQGGAPISDPKHHVTQRFKLRKQPPPIPRQPSPVATVRPQMPQRVEGAAAGERRRDEGMRRVEEASPHGWADQALAVVRGCAEKMIEFTTDDVWATGLRKPREERALGPVMNSAARRGWIVRTDRTRRSDRPEAHRNPKQIWISRLRRA